MARLENTVGEEVDDTPVGIYRISNKLVMARPNSGVHRALEGGRVVCNGAFVFKRDEVQASTAVW